MLHITREKFGFPLIFMVVMDVITQIINLAKAMGMFRGFKMIEEVSITHLLFEDDILTFLMTLGGFTPHISQFQ